MLHPAPAPRAEGLRVLVTADPTVITAVLALVCLGWNRLYDHLGSVERALTADEAADRRLRDRSARRVAGAAVRRD